MASWRDAILREFTPQLSRLTLVADPDGLLLEEGMLKGIEERGFELIPYEDPIAFRYAYESRYRARWDRGEMTDLVVVLRAATEDLRALPYDLLQAGRQLSVSLGDLFPNLSLRIVGALDRSDLDALYEAQSRERLTGRLGDNRTSSFVLRHVFNVDPDTIRDDVSLLRFLLERHHKRLRIPEVLEDYLVSKLTEGGRFGEWPLDLLVRDREAFFAFLQERWPVFLDRLAGVKHAMRDVTASRKLVLPGPRDLPFEHNDVRVYVDSLFFEGLLEPVVHGDASALARSWAVAGVRVDAREDQHRQWRGLLEAVEQDIPEPEARHRAWQEFALKWGRLVALRYSGEAKHTEQELARFVDLRDRVDEAFLEWVQERFHTLHNQPPLPPVMVHHVPRWLAGHMERSREDRVALVVVDGLALHQWAVIKGVLQRQDASLRLEEDAIFAWIPTLTNVSRQACFDGRPPRYFANSFGRTDNDGRAWKRFWEDEGLAGDAVGYERGISEERDLQRVERHVDHPRIRAFGLVVDKVDRIMHGMQLGSAGMHSQVRQWAEQGMLVALLNLLLKRDFAVFLTADHGNIEAAGCGQPKEGATADVRGERARVFRDAGLRARVHERFPEAIVWEPAGLPEEYLPLLAPDRKAFVREGTTVVGHGGITVEEVIVPLVKIERRP